MHDLIKESDDTSWEVYYEGRRIGSARGLRARVRGTPKVLYEMGMIPGRPSENPFLSGKNPNISGIIKSLYLKEEDVRFDQLPSMDLTFKRHKEGQDYIITLEEMLFFSYERETSQLVSNISFLAKDAMQDVEYCLRNNQEAKHLLKRPF